MIGSLTFNNFRFFEQFQTMSFFADLRTRKLVSNSLKISNKNVLKTTAIYGSNNSGKSNIVDLFYRLKMVLEGKDVDFNTKTLGDSETVELSITFNNNDGDGWFCYSFSFNHEKRSFLKEKFSSISYYDEGAPFEKVIFEKDVESLRLMILGEEKSELLNVITSNKPLLYTLNLEKGNFSELSIYLEKIKKLSDSIIVLRMFNIPIQNTINALKGSDNNKKNFIKEFVKNADLTIDDFDYAQKQLINFEKPKTVNEDALKEIAQLEEALHLGTKYKNKFVPSILFDSSGTKKIQAIASFIYDSIFEGKTLIVDELDNGLHYKLSRAVVSAFNNLANKSGQLIFTAHDLLLISNNNLMRKDQIYFVSRENLNSRLVWLRDLTVASGGPRDMEVLVKRYNHGDFVRTPSPSFIDNIFDIKAR